MGFTYRMRLKDAWRRKMETCIRRRGQSGALKTPLRSYGPAAFSRLRVERRSGSLLLSGVEHRKVVTMFIKFGGDDHERAIEDD